MRIIVEIIVVEHSSSSLQVCNLLGNLDICDLSARIVRLPKRQYGTLLLVGHCC